MDTQNVILIVLSIITITLFFYTIYLNMNKLDYSIEKKDMEVYHIYNNSHTYPMAKKKCELYGGRLASEKEVKDAYNKGANWCNYGWSEEKKILFPAQKRAVELGEYQKVNGNNPCQKEGVNGGKFPNTYMKFGVNCYGLKPELLENDKNFRKEDDEKIKRILKREKIENQAKRNEELKRRNLERLRNKVRKTVSDDIILDNNNINNRWSEHGE
jgi:hypothetical protein